MDEPFRIFLVAGEPSGDALGGRLLRALRQEAGERGIVVAGIGGEQMRDQGLLSLFPIQELAVMGLVEVLPRVPRLARRLRQTVDAIARFRPQVVVTIDSSGFNKRLARRLIEVGEPAWRVHYVAPMVWAWRPNRVHAMAALFDHLMALFPFEPPWFERAGLPTTFVGHPAVEAARGDGAAFRRENGMPDGAPLLCVLPGSRRGEVSRLLPVFERTVAMLAAAVPGLQVVLPTVEIVAGMVRKRTARWPVPVRITTGEHDKAGAFAASDAALAASGTVALELALAGVPTVVAYRVHPITASMARRLLSVRYASLPNILLDRPLLPELLQENCRPDRLSAALLPLLTDPAARAAQRAGLAEVAAAMGGEGPPPSVRAARTVLALAARPREGQSAGIRSRTE